MKLHAKILQLRQILLKVNSFIFFEFVNCSGVKFPFPLENEQLIALLCVGGKILSADHCKEFFIM